MKRLFTFFSIGLLIITLTACTTTPKDDTSSGSTGRTAGTLVDDQEIRIRLRRLLSKRPDINENSRIHITSYNQRVLLYGRTRDLSLARAFAQECAKQPKVRAVFNEVSQGELGDSWDYSRDAALVAKIKTSLVRAGGDWFDPTKVKVSVEFGVVYLMGLLTQTEAERVIEHIRGISGVKKVVDLIEYLD